MFSKKQLLLGCMLLGLTGITMMYKMTFLELKYSFPPSSFRITENSTIYRFRIVSSNHTVLINKSFEDKWQQFAVFPALCLTKSAIIINPKEMAKRETFLTETSAKGLSLKEIFRPTIRENEKLICLYVFQTFIDMCRQNNITYFLYDGTLIGAYRHNRLIPWDDDIDVFVNASQRQQLIKAAAAESLHGFHLHVVKSFQWKFYHKTISKGYGNKQFRWPYIDIFFWIVENNKLYDYTHDKNERQYDLKLVFPLSNCLFEGLLLPCPANTNKFLASKYNIDTCMTNVYSHKHEIPMPWKKSVPCKELKNILPFAPQM